MSNKLVMAPAPADRAPGDCGLRGRVAALLVVGAALALLVPSFHGTTSGGVSGGPWSVSYSYRTSGLSMSGIAPGASALFLAGTLLWILRRRPLIALTAVLATAGIGELAWTFANPPEAARISAATYRRIALGTSESLLTARLGSPLSASTSATRGSVSIGCLIYQTLPSRQPALRHGNFQDPSVTGLGASNYVFCIDHGRVRVKLAF